MAKFMVMALIDATVSVDVEAETAADAVEKACDTDRMSPHVCHQCSDRIEIGDPWCFRVHNKDGEQVYTNEVPDLRLASDDDDLRAELARPTCEGTGTMTNPTDLMRAAIELIAAWDAMPYECNADRIGQASFDLRKAVLAAPPTSPPSDAATRLRARVEAAEARQKAGEWGGPEFFHHEVRALLTALDAVAQPAGDVPTAQPDDATLRAAERIRTHQDIEGDHAFFDEPIAEAWYDRAMRAEAQPDDALLMRVVAAIIRAARGEK